eukprot:9461259-Pyramimonas_sp.AAC.1
MGATMIIQHKKFHEELAAPSRGEALDALEALCDPLPGVGELPDDLPDDVPPPDSRLPDDVPDDVLRRAPAASSARLCT